MFYTVFYCVVTVPPLMTSPLTQGLLSCYLSVSPGHVRLRGLETSQAQQEVTTVTPVRSISIRASERPHSQLWIYLHNAEEIISFNLLCVIYILLASSVGLSWRKGFSSSCLLVFQLVVCGNISLHIHRHHISWREQKL